MKRIIVGLLLLVGLISVGFALDVNDTDTVNITVTVSTKTMIDVNPAALTYSNVDPGSTKNVSDEGYYAIQIENIGSHNITHIWFNNTMPSERPFATANASKYNAGNFVALRKEGATGQYWFPNRLEFNETRSLVYLKDPSGNMPPSGYSYGRFRNNSFEYFWMLDSLTNCNATGTQFYIGDKPHTENATGTTDFTQSDHQTISLTNVATATNWSWGYISSGPLTGYGVAVYYTCDRVMFVHWNKDAPGADTDSNIPYFWDASGSDPNLTPGNSTVAEIAVYVPYGVMEGTVEQGKLTVIVNDQ